MIRSSGVRATGCWLAAATERRITTMPAVVFPSTIIVAHGDSQREWSSRTGIDTLSSQPSWSAIYRSTRSRGASLPAFSTLIRTGTNDSPQPAHRRCGSICTIVTGLLFRIDSRDNRMLRSPLSVQARPTQSVSTSTRRRSAEPTRCSGMSENSSLLMTITRIARKAASCIRRVWNSATVRCQIIIEALSSMIRTRSSQRSGMGSSSGTHNCVSAIRSAVLASSRIPYVIESIWRRSGRRARVTAAGSLIAGMAGAPTIASEAASRSA